MRAIKFGVDSSRRFSFRARAHAHRHTDATDLPTHAWASDGVGNYYLYCLQCKHRVKERRINRAIMCTPSTSAQC